MGALEWRKGGGRTRVEGKDGTGDREDSGKVRVERKVEELK